MTLTIELLAKQHNVHTRTIRRWLAKEGVYRPREGYGPGKIDAKKASKIRGLYRTDNYTQSELAKKFGVTQATICRVINNKTHKVDLLVRGSAEISVQKNPLSASGQG